ncbi:MAG: DUF2269 family protein [Gaiellaceae bacterium]
MDELALYLHLIGVVAIFSGMAVAGVGFGLARRRSRPSEIALLLSAARVAVLLLAVGVLLAVVFGLWLVHLDGWSYGSGWIDLAIALLVVSLALGGIGGQPAKRARLLAARLSREGDRENEELRRLLDDCRGLALNWLSTAGLLAVMALMVWRPGL